MKKTFLTLLLALAGTPAAIRAQELTSTEMTSMVAQTSPTTISIHDPSAVYRNGQYTIWGSHLGVATSDDMVSFESLTAGNTTFRKLESQGATKSSLCNYEEAFNVQQVTTVKNANGVEVEFPNFDAEAYCSRYGDSETWISGVMWAPDIIYNPTMEKWCMYLSLNGDNWSSIIILLTAASSTGPFTYQGPIVMGGFNGQTYDGISAPTYADTDMEIALGESLTATPSRYIQTDNGKYWPNCIDPCTFFDEDGELWMTYGSWSGGIFMLKLDKETGLRDYTYTYESDYSSKGASGTSDPYFGLKIAGGYYVSGEGSYVQHIGDYYYLFMSYGGYDRAGGYDMRVFRSTSPTGPYTDENGTSALFTSWQNNYSTTSTQRGMRLMGAYNGWGLQTVGQRSIGHNSATTDDEGRALLVAHTKFNDGTDGHQVRVHQLFINENGWPVAAPFTYNGETLTDEQLAAASPVETDDIPGTYQILLHVYGQDYENLEEATPQSITLSSDGKVTGDYTGTWTQTSGTGYITLRLGSTSYYGVLCANNVDGATTSSLKRSGLTTISFTALSNGGTPVWGYKLDNASAVASNWSANPFPLKDNQNVTAHLSLMFDATDDATVTWTSSEPDIISETGKYNPTDEATKVTLTRTISCGDAYVTESATVTAAAATKPSGDAISGLVAYYPMDETPLRNQYKASGATDYDRAYLSKTGSGTAPSLSSDWDRSGQVLSVSGGSAGNISYLRTANPLLGLTDLEGFSISMWVQRQDTDSLGGIFALGSNYSGNAQDSCFYFTGNTFLCYDNAAGTNFKVNNPETSILTTIPEGEWTLVTLTCGSSNGVRLYVNGTTRRWSDYDATPTATSAKTLPYEALTQSATTFKYLFLGGGCPYGSAAVCIDELMVWNRELSSSDVSALNTLEKRVTDFTVGENGTAVTAPNAATSSDDDSPWYDLQGRRANSITKGILIRNGKKMIVR